MRKFEYKPPRVHNGDLRTPVIFFEYQPNQGPLPGESVKRTLFNCWAKVDQVWLKDLEQAKANNTLSDITITIRDPQFEYKPSNLHYLEVDALDYQGYHYNIKKVQPNLQDRRFIDIVAGLVK
ncbi:phage head closure protein [Alkalicoccobacillus plakortidis]|uniref:Phage head closure protein n=1 Tax=Alkalicoccobacillus plakortidis TaxID=444060 RepID=A0ABT0XK34_9BACI|nr:phage head closure protein [Alkalicoccobacillus plakortidis]MCM2675582.1 phage head closure protein [Alkalicoccobacillus plakortidis]